MRKRIFEPVPSPAGGRRSVRRSAGEGIRERTSRTEVRYASSRGLTGPPRPNISPTQSAAAMPVQCSRQGRQQTCTGRTQTEWRVLPKSLSPLSFLPSFLPFCHDSKLGRGNGCGSPREDREGGRTVVCGEQSRGGRARAAGGSGTLRISASSPPPSLPRISFPKPISKAGS